ncbi:unnamed protein product [Wuchereria bancrofti]|uniref:Serpin domain-containing protein n=1 Tax=Wuchereria bancrofti TaxID=6293 RepID=A0A3P7G156_WUCBA|nr:unnamed protein product [Wuchereria bancrofti]
MQLLIILPKKTFGLAKLEDKLTGEELFSYIGALNHLTKLSYVIDEKGINNENSSIPVRNDMVMDKREAFRANHPFLYAITDNHGTVLWIGRFTRKNRETIVENSDESLECKEMPKKKRQKL